MLVGAMALLSPLLILVFAPIFGNMWQVLNGNSLDFRGWTVAVPSGFFARDREGSALHLWKLDLGRPIFEAPYAHISIFVPEPESDAVQIIDPDRFAAAVAATAKAEGYKPSGHISANVGHTVGFCVELASVENSRWIQVRCLVKETRVAVLYEGHEKYKALFYSFLKTLRAPTRERKARLRGEVFSHNKSLRDPSGSRW
jgi:hypothetical protein